MAYLNRATSCCPIGVENIKGQHTADLLSTLTPKSEITTSPLSNKY